MGGATHLCRASWQSRGSETLRRLEGGLAPGEDEEERVGREKRTRECDGTISRRAAGGASGYIQMCGSASGMQRVRTREHE